MTANGQEVGLNDPFIVGGEALMYPGDPNASGAQTINCRCTTTVRVVDDPTQPA